MERILASLFIGLCIFLGNISGQAKSYKIVEHISSEHSHHHHEHGQKHEHKHEHKTGHHHHHAELSFLTLQLALPVCSEYISNTPASFISVFEFYSLNVLNQLSFSPPVFRPPIA